MESLIQTQIKHIVETSWADRWQVYQRLQELDIPCTCQTNQPLTVEITNSADAIQLWSVIRHLSASRQELISTLRQSWQYSV